MLFRPKMHNLGLIMRKHQTNPNPETFCKMAVPQTSRCQGNLMRLFQIEGDWRGVTTECSGWSCIGSSAIKDIIETGNEAWMGCSRKGYIGVFWTALNIFCILKSFQNKSKKKKCGVTTDWLCYFWQIISLFMPQFLHLLHETYNRYLKDTVRNRRNRVREVWGPV